MADQPPRSNPRHNWRSRVGPWCHGTWRASRVGECPTNVKEVVMLVGHSRRAISNALGVGFTRGMYPVSLAFKRRMHDGFPTRF